MNQPDHQQWIDNVANIDKRLYPKHTKLLPNKPQSTTEPPSQNTEPY